MATQDSSHPSLFPTPEERLVRPAGSASNSGPAPPPLPGNQLDSQPQGDVPPLPKTASEPAVLRPILLDDEAAAVLADEKTEPGRQELIDWLGNWMFETPAWLISLVTHLVIFIILGLVFIQLPTNNVLMLDAVFADQTGEQLELDTTFESPALADLPSHELAIDNELPPIDIPLAAPPNLTPADNAVHQQVDLDAPVLGMALNGRQEGQKQILLKAFGGNAATENAVQLGLEWLERNQKRDGSWSLAGPYKNGCRTENQIAATAMAMLAFQGAGHTHQQGTFRKSVSDAKRWLLRKQETNGAMAGRFYRARHAFFRGEDNHTFYSNGMATMALCELYAMTADESLRYPAQLAVDFLIANQNPDGGWRYIRDTESDTSVTGWIVMALQSAKMGGLKVPDEVLANVESFLDDVASDYGSRYAYQKGQVDTLSMTAEALLCRQYLGWPRDHQPLLTGVTHLLRNPINRREPNVYYWYYATQVLHHMEGDLWAEWNAVLRERLPAAQERVGDERGSWSPHNDIWSEYAGRLFTTCMNIFMLEVYYRHLPIYSSVYR